MSVTLICLHYGGGNRFSFLKLKEFLDQSIEMKSLEIPGHGKRLNEPLLTDLELIAKDVFEQIKPILDDNEYILYGHSLGGTVLFLVTRLLQTNNFKMPGHLIVSGCKGPKFNHVRSSTCHLLNDEDFKLELKKLGGFPKEALENDELLTFFLPILRADFKAIETYQYKTEEPFKVPITVLSGLNENITLEELESWKDETALSLDFLQFPGHHFFILERFKEIGEIINDISKNKLSESRAIIL
ncbi:thioesterase domain-containing protein [Aquimarina sp. ERC-38]|uniref:thioesterase II family protein n=1 Tax=Aquimarina sp. ERC-38 TaxID=2949996 RepID=UPI0022479DFE|nr:thioesterase domain-containing protein [Aquimarina sp. ERC-38]UZO79156.1 thioesterase domain-containing protein [Aquimarina sp. ERC-38]